MEEMHIFRVLQATLALCFSKNLAKESKEIAKMNYGNMREGLTESERFRRGSNPPPTNTRGADGRGG